MPELSNSIDIAYYTLQRADIRRYKSKDKPYSIVDHIGTISFSESIHSPILYGEIQMIDTSDIVTNMPIIGEEILSIAYTDFFGNELEQEFFIYAIDEMLEARHTNVLYYKIKFISIEHFLSASKSISKGYRQRQLSTIVQEIFDEYLVNTEEFAQKTNTIDIEPTLGIQSLIIPDLEPISAIDFLKRRSASLEYEGHNFYFFQTRSQFRFTTDERLIEESQRGKKDFNPKNVYVYDPAILDQPVEKRSIAMNNIQSFILMSKFNTINEMKSGAMSIDAITIDLQQKQYKHNVYEYKESYKEIIHTDSEVKFKHTDKFIEDFYGPENHKVSMIVWEDIDRQFTRLYKDILGNRIPNYYYRNTLQAKIEVFGRNDLSSGDVIKLQIPELQDNVNKGKEIHRDLSGYWLINSINHELSVGKNYNMTMVISKDLIKDGV